MSDGLILIGAFLVLEGAVFLWTRARTPRTVDRALDRAIEKVIEESK